LDETKARFIFATVSAKVHVVFKEEVEDDGVGCTPYNEGIGVGEGDFVRSELVLGVS
jgi:hypothetical protein